ncbi:SDR family NAD(P)-dependent oxidoreductase, partial [Bacillus thuringiensis]|uniref:SDR family NAD(P)-dependent oxidoreductase n=1 Tax=Bacillus thuringiensis TaxID=1428 RepID=UPI0011A236F5
NIFSYFHLPKPALSHLNQPHVIINTPSILPYQPNQTLIHYSPTKRPILPFTTSLSQSLVQKAIPVNPLPPAPISTPLIPSS